MGPKTLKPCAIFGDMMIIQRNKPVKVFGECESGREVGVKLGPDKANCLADEAGSWEVVLPAIPAGGPYNLEIRSGGEKIIYKDILIGDLWLCSGQSNMTLTFDRLKYKYPEDISTINNPAIRMFTVPDAFEFKGPKNDLPGGEWLEAGPDTILRFSGAAYYFGQFLQEDIKVPIGLIVAAIGGTPIQSWMSEEAMAGFPQYMKEMPRLKDDEYLRNFMASEQKLVDDWQAEADAKDAGNSKDSPWSAKSADFSDGYDTEVPGSWEEETKGQNPGVFWFCREFELPENFVPRKARLWLGRIVDSDEVWVNGVMVGGIGYQYPPRIYDIAAKLLKPGNNRITVRVKSNLGDGQFAVGKPYYLDIGGEKIDLTGTWKRKTGCLMRTMHSAFRAATKPIGLYNAMIAPLRKLAINGLVWYQGESNDPYPMDYGDLLNRFIADWREKFNEPDLPCIITQLPNCGEAAEGPSESSWAQIRDGQRRALKLANTALTVNYDIGEWNDLHPLNKKDIGRRLAIAALKLAYGRNDLEGCPLFISAKKEGDKIIVSCSNTGGGLKTSGGRKPGHIAVAGKDGKFAWTEAKLDGDRIIVDVSNFEKPKRLRYAWAENPEGANIRGQNGLPLTPFECEIGN